MGISMNFLCGTTREGTKYHIDGTGTSDGSKTKLLKLSMV